MIEGFTALYIFMLAGFTGYEVIARVPVILHTPLMSGSNAISGITLIGAIASLKTDNLAFAAVLGTAAVAFATINVVGGYMVTNRMLEMFKKKEKNEGASR